MSKLPLIVKKDSGWNWNPYIFSSLFSKDIATFDFKHLIVISKLLILKGSFNLSEWYRPTLNILPFLNKDLLFTTFISDWNPW